MALRSFKGVDGKFGQPLDVKVIAEVAVGDIERSKEAKEIIRLVTDHATLAASHSSRAVIMYNESLIDMIKSINHAALIRVIAAEKSLLSPTCSIFTALKQLFCMGACVRPRPRSDTDTVLDELD